MENKRTIKSYSRTVAKSLSEKQKMDLSEYSDQNSFLKFKDNYKQFILEIGFGNGENLEKLALENPDSGIIGVEPFKNACVKMIKTIKEKVISNILLLNDDIKNVYDEFPAKFFQQTYVLYPDPWPKKKHNKRRLMNEDFFTAIVKKTSDEIIFSTDDIDYFETVVTCAKNIAEVKILDNGENLIANTRYQQKAKNEGRKCNYAVFCNLK